MKSLEYIERELEWLRTGGDRQLDQDKEIENLKKVKEDLEMYNMILDRLYLSGIELQIIKMEEIDGYKNDDGLAYFKLKEKVRDRLADKHYKELFENNKEEDN